MARTVAIRAPTPLASVTVAMPVKMDPSTAKIRNKGGMTRFMTSKRTPQVIGRRSGDKGAASGLK